MIIDFNSYKKKEESKISDVTTQDLFNLFLIFKHEDPMFVNLYDLQEAMAKYKSYEKFSILYSNVKIETNDNNREIIDFKESYNEYCEKGIIVEDTVCPLDFIIIGDNSYFCELKEKYNSKILDLFNDLMFYINNDLKYGPDDWELFADDEIVTYPKYPGIVTGEFIGQTKDNVVMQKIKQKCIERLKNNNTF